MYTPTRVLHGTTNATMHIQSVVDGIISDLCDNVEAWLYDVAPHAASEAVYLATLRKFNTQISTAKLKLHAKKKTLVAHSITFCGRTVSEAGFEFTPKSLSALQYMPTPTTGYQLHQYLGATGWMRAHIQQYAAKVAPLQNL